MGKQLIIVGADFSAVAIGTAKVLDYITASISGTQYTNTAPTGLVVTAYYTQASGGGSSVVTGYTTNPTTWTSTVGQQTMTISYTRGGITRTTTVTADVQQGSGPVPTTYTVSAVITNGTATSTSVTSGGTATLTVTPNSGHTNPTSVTISSGTATSATISGATITVTNVTSDVVLAATCPASGGSWADIPMSPGNNFSANFVGLDTRATQNQFMQVHTGDVLTLLNPGTTATTFRWAIYYANSNYTDDIYAYAQEHGAATMAGNIESSSWHTNTPITITSEYNNKWISVVINSGTGTPVIWDNTKKLGDFITYTQA